MLLVTGDIVSFTSDRGYPTRGRLCVCDCGQSKMVRLECLRNSRTRSCGCLKKISGPANATKHGHAKPGSKNELRYAVWRAMINRCHNPKNHAFYNYGARGISVCERWKLSFTAFMEDMGHPPGKGYSIDRMDVNSGYSKENCRWATSTVQANNSRKNLLIESGGVTMTLAQWARQMGACYGTLHSRIERGEMPFEGAKIIFRRRQLKS